MLVAALLAIGLGAAPQVVGVTSGELRDQAMVQSALTSTTIEWTEAFAAHGGTYRPPQVVLLRTPVGHPARGAGYSRTLGLVIDLGDMDGIIETLGDDGPSMAGMVIAHEVGHHVQALLGNDPEVQGEARERQADCLSGWWLVQANARATADQTQPAWPIIDIAYRLPQALRLLEQMQSAQADGGLANPETHGGVDARVAAFRQGMAAATPWVCLWGDNP